MSGITLSLTKSSVVVGSSTTYKVTANYSDDSHEDITSKASMSTTNSTGLSVSGGNITTSKAIGCLGQRSITASYNGKTDSQNFTVTTDYKSDDITLSWTSDVGRSGSAASGTLSGFVKKNDASQVTVSFSGNLKTSNNDTYAVSNSFIEFYVKDTGTPDSSYLKASTSQTYWAAEGDGEVYQLRYLGEPVKTWTINWNAY